MTQDILSELQWRGLVHQTSGEQIGAWLAEQRRTLYAGFDPTAESLHVGSLLPLLALRRFQRCGHRPIALVGGATGMIGDPSGKSAERNLLSVDVLQANVAGLESQIRQFLDFDSPNFGARLVNNYEWMSGFSYLGFLRDIGKHFPVSAMLAKDAVQSRIGRDDAGISYTEFSYMLLQAYDFVYLHRTFGCELQIGGSDQWGNITAGIDLARRIDAAHLHGITSPLLLKSDGTKMGKTADGAVWLSRERTSPYAFYQYWINVADEDAGMCLRFLTELARDEIEALDEARRGDPGSKASQKKLAAELTRLVHGDEGLHVAQRATEILFGTAIENLTDAQLIDIFRDVPSRELPSSRLADAGLPLVDALVEAGLATSKGAARRLIEQGGAYVNNRRCAEVGRALSDADRASETVVVLRSGAKKYALLRFV